MSRFYNYARAHQIDWRGKYLTDLTELGTHRDRSYPHLLPSRDWVRGLHLDIQKSLPDYLQSERIQPHNHKHNLLSSWVLCANMYFPFRRDWDGRKLIAGFLSDVIELDGWDVSGVELEYAAYAPLDPATVLGERRGHRGANQTSPDVAFMLSKPSGIKGIVLVECKYVESDFGICSGYSQTKKLLRSRTANPNRDRCNNASLIVEDPENSCHLVSWGRKYWQHLTPIVDKDAFNELSYCPARSNGYQLLREYAYAQALADSSQYEVVIYAIAWDPRNEALIRSMRGAGLREIETGWSKLFPRGVPIKTWSHNQWVDYVDRNGGSAWQPWVEYVSARYDMNL